MGRENIRIQDCLNVKNKPGWVQMISGYNEMQGWVEKISGYKVEWMIRGYQDESK